MKKLTDKLKSEAKDKKVQIIAKDEESIKLEKIFNNMFYLDKDIPEETKFIKSVMTRGAESQERIGLHASAIIVSDNKWCTRRQVLSLLYRQEQGEQDPVGLRRIYEEGNAIHEKWQRLFIRAGYSKANQLDVSQMNDEFEVSFTPDIICNVPGFGEMIGEIKSMNTFSFQKTTGHPSGEKQCQFYMYLTGIHKGFVLMEDKNTQDFRVKYMEYDENIVLPFLDRLEEVKYYKQKVLKQRKMVKRCKGCNKPNCKTAEGCAMRDACYNVGMGRQLIRPVKFIKKDE